MIHTGDARQLISMIEPESVNLIFTDPVYNQIEDYAWLASVASVVLKPDAPCLVWQQVGLIPQTCNAMMQHLNYRWTLVHYKPNRVKEKFGAAGFSKWEPLIWFDKGRTPRRRWLDVFQTNAFASGHSNHEWSKAIEGIIQVVEHFSRPGDLVLDPFCGGGVVPAACKMLGRHCVAFEINPETAERARQRVEMTQPPLLIAEQSEQMEMGL